MPKTVEFEGQTFEIPDQQERAAIINQTFAEPCYWNEQRRTWYAEGVNLAVMNVISGDQIPASAVAAVGVRTGKECGRFQSRSRTEFEREAVAWAWGYLAGLEKAGVKPMDIAAYVQKEIVEEML